LQIPFAIRRTVQATNEDKGKMSIKNMTLEYTTEKSETIKKISSMWGNLTEEQYRLLTDNLQIHTYQKNEVIYKEMEIPEVLMFLVSGKVKVYKEGVGGRFLIMRVFKPGEFFGYRAYLAKQEYRTASMAFEDCVIACLPMKVFIELLRKNSDISLFFINCLAKELGHSDIRTINLTQKHVCGRLAEALLFLIDNYGIDEDGWIEISTSRADIANMSNMNTSNAIRTLSLFAERNIIATKGRRIRIINHAELKKIAELG